MVSDHKDEESEEEMEERQVTKEERARRKKETKKAKKSNDLRIIVDNLRLVEPLNPCTGSVVKCSQGPII